MSEINKLIQSAPEGEQERIDYVNHIVGLIYQQLNPIKQPIACVQWVPIDQVEPNDYNPNSVAGKEMSLLHTSITHDGYTQPIVTIYDDQKEKYIIVDGFHRYYTCKSHPDLQEKNKGRLPIVVIEKDINERMAATVRHNRARGKHSIEGMSSMVFSMLNNGMSDTEICNELGMEAEELLRLKHITGFSKLFSDQEYKRAWETKNQIKHRKMYDKDTSND